MRVEGIGRIDTLGAAPSQAEMQAMQAAAAAQAAAQAASRYAGDAAFEKAKADPAVSAGEAVDVARSTAAAVYQKTLETGLSRLPQASKVNTEMVLIVGAVGLVGLYLIMRRPRAAQPFRRRR